MRSDLTGDVAFALALYSLAEHQAGHASVIRVVVDGEKFSVSDDGRGHSFERVLGEAPYVNLVYTQLQYPFEQGIAPPPVQLQGIGISLINALCSQLKVTVQKREGSLVLSFEGGDLKGRELSSQPCETTGNTIEGVLYPQYQAEQQGQVSLEGRLRRLVAGASRLQLFLNGEALHANA